MTAPQEGPPTGPMVQVRDVTRVFRSAGTAVTAVNHVSLTVQRGEFMAIVGRSGSGKTTLLNLIAGLDKPDEGEVIVDGLEVHRFGDAETTTFRRRTVGFVFQSFGLLPLLSAAENIDLALRIAGAGLRERSERTRELLTQVGLTERAHHRPYELSGGEQQRVAVARALANRPPLIIADEPTGELDSTTGAQIFQLLRDVATQGVTVIAATHDPFVIEHVDRVLEMSDGHMLPEGEGSLIAQHRRRGVEVPRPRTDPPPVRR
ncbi:MAG: ABC transporter ATP-binding protein [Chloroflexi bacterium]|nr:ABC transporter ATP-binding protein [Chloroflexota bacterium]MDA1239775.1 ABC transporter ATP-binding protein [Chloroflexota bacterium]MQC25414.1 ABC transporter ATP-binding protein [Chloroflexota bacterium]MQC48110.1 ABC transporter ATP-binding protein [Chloroflexota bacterium]